MNLVNVKDIVEENGKTVEENNLEKGHNIPLDTLVEIDLPGSEYHGMRMYVADHSRDCDGTPLYSLGAKGDRFRKEEPGDDALDKKVRAILNMKLVHGFSADCLVIIK